MSTSPTNPRLNTLKSKAVKLEQQVKIHDPSTDILTSFQINTSAYLETSNQWKIDVFPNMVPILMYVMLTARENANTIQLHNREHSYLSVATICMYYMTVVYGFFLLNDLYVRPSPSAHARSWNQISWKHDFVTYLLSLPMPESLSVILSQFHSFHTNRTKNVLFVPSAAGFDHDQFFGRVFPLNMFAAIHDCAGNHNSNSSRIQVFQDLFSRVLYTIKNPSFNCVIPDLIGITIDQSDPNPNTVNYMNSKLYKVFSAVFNPFLFSDSQYFCAAPLSSTAPEFPTNNVNAYDLLFSATTSANLRELKVVLQGVSRVILDYVPCKVTLSQFISEGSSPSILKHGYSTYALPTWSYSVNNNKAAHFASIKTIRHISEEERAQEICFLQAPHDNEDLVQFSDENDTAPRVLVLDTDDELTTTAHLPLLAGKIIESFELDGTTIEMPNANKSLGMQNCMFADSAIPYKYVRPGSHYHPRKAGSVLAPLRRASPNSSPRLPASSLLYDRTKVMLPVNLSIHEQIAGLTIKSPVNVLGYVQPFLGSKTVDSSSNAKENDDVPAMSENQLLVWSPYTYTPYESNDYPIPDLSASRHYYLTNLRTIFGTDCNLILCNHPYEAMPVV